MAVQGGVARADNATKDDHIPICVYTTCMVVPTDIVG